MKKSYLLVLTGVTWIAIATWAEARRASTQEDSPALRAGIEADLATKYCPAFALDAERFRNYARANGLSHEDFFMRRRSAKLQQEIARTTQQLRQSPDQGCTRLWEEYGTSPSAVQLLTQR
ncbi:hypothetical protein ACQKJ1_28300 [Methylorubrum rhodesianum]|uniref:hypothetical protein n=1 Tax=Methylorubrum rhodesianum TaxID=29427 RepID=UPI003D06379F